MIEVVDYNALDLKLTRHELKSIERFALVGSADWPELRVYMHTKIAAANKLCTITMSASFVELRGKKIRDFSLDT